MSGNDHTASPMDRAIAAFDACTHGSLSRRPCLQCVANAIDVAMRDAVEHSEIYDPPTLADLEDLEGL